MNIVKAQKRSENLMQKLVVLWEESVRETHLFLSENEIAHIKQYVPQALENVEHLFVAEDDSGQPLAFMGIGKQLLQNAVTKHCVKKVCVNEQNPQAKGFYEHLGFRVYDRSEYDEQGNPYPILHLTFP